MINDKAPYNGRNESVKFWDDEFEINKWNETNWISSGNIFGHLEPSSKPTDDLLLFLKENDLKINNRLIKNNIVYHVINIKDYPFHSEITLKILNKDAKVFETVDNSIIGAGELSQDLKEIKTIKVAFDGISGSVAGTRFVEGSQTATAFVFAEIEFDRLKHKLEIDGQKYNITQIIDESGDKIFFRLSLERND